MPPRRGWAIRFVVIAAHRPQADGRDLGGQRLGADDQYPRSGLQLVGQDVGGALRAGDDIVSGRREADIVQMAGDLVRAARRIIGDE